MVFVSKISHEIVAEIAHAVHCKVDSVFGANSTKRLPSAELVQGMHRAYVTRHLLVEFELLWIRCQISRLPGYP